MANITIILNYPFPHDFLQILHLTLSPRQKNVPLKIYFFKKIDKKSVFKKKRKKNKENIKVTQRVTVGPIVATTRCIFVTFHTLCIISWRIIPQKIIVLIFILLIWVGTFFLILTNLLLILHCYLFLFYLIIILWSRVKIQKLNDPSFFVYRFLFCWNLFDFNFPGFPLL